MLVLTVAAVFSVRELVWRQVVREVPGDVCISLDLWPDGSATQLSIEGHLDGSEFGQWHQGLFILQETFDEVLGELSLWHKVEFH